MEGQRNLDMNNRCRVSSRVKAKKYCAYDGQNDFWELRFVDHIFDLNLSLFLDDGDIPSRTFWTYLISESRTLQNLRSPGVL
jgi:hypothetical protein